MPIPYFVDEVFEPNPDAEVGRIHIEGLGTALVIDNFYKHPEMIHEILQNSWVQAWKWSKNSRNFIDYFDCRHSLNMNPYQDREFLNVYTHHYNLIAKNLGYNCRRDAPNLMDFNLFKWIKLPESASIQSYPHQDSKIEDPRIAGIVYLNKDEDCNGGTAFYKDMGVSSEVTVMESQNIAVDVDIYEPAGLIEAKFNRCAIYPGWWMHGAYIEDHKFYKEKWRINQVFFHEMVR